MLLTLLKYYRPPPDADLPAPARSTLRAPESHAVPPVRVQPAFVGRTAMLATLDEWAVSADPVLVVDALGELG